MRFDLIDLRLFLHVCDTGTITGGAERSNITLQSASGRILGMENELGVPLLLRSKGGAQLTDAGQSLAHHARIVLQQIEYMRGELHQHSEGMRGHIRLLCNTSALSEYLPDALAGYLAINPNISIHVEERLSYEIAHAIRSRTADLGILSRAVNVEGFELLPFRNDRLVLVAAPQSPFVGRASVAFQDIVDAEFVGLADGSALQAHIGEHARKLGKRVNYRVRLKNFDAICQLVARGVGIAIVPRSAALNAAKLWDFRVIELSDPWAFRQLMICARHFAELPKYTQDFVKHLAAPCTEDERMPEEG